jgi:hypothetical protein
MRTTTSASTPSVKCSGPMTLAPGRPGRTSASPNAGARPGSGSRHSDNRTSSAALRRHAPTRIHRHSERRPVVPTLVTIKSSHGVPSTASTECGWIPTSFHTQRSGELARRGLRSVPLLGTPVARDPDLLLVVCDSVPTHLPRTSRGWRSHGPGRPEARAGARCTGGRPRTRQKLARLGTPQARLGTPQGASGAEGQRRQYRASRPEVRISPDSVRPTVAEHHRSMAVDTRRYSARASQESGP